MYGYRTSYSTHPLPPPIIDYSDSGIPSLIGVAIPLWIHRAPFDLSSIGHTSLAYSSIPLQPGHNCRDIDGQDSSISGLKYGALCSHRTLTMPSSWSR